MPKPQERQGSIAFPVAEVGLATVFSHAVAALSIGTCFQRPGIPPQAWIAAVICSVIPDVDVIGFRFGIRYGDFWGHRGFTHSLVFAAVIACTAALVLWQAMPSIRRLPLIAYLFLATASHGLLDAMTNGGRGVAFFSPFDNGRYFLPWRPIQVSPISAGLFFSSRVEAILASEFLWIWIPAVLLAVLAFTIHRFRAKMKAEFAEFNQEAGSPFLKKKDYR